MKTIKAIVLTFDKYRDISKHMVHCYNKIWPSHPFCFRVPYQIRKPDIKNEKVQYIKCCSDIKKTVLALVDDLDDEEMVYWCLDDKYPMMLDVRRIQQIHEWIFSKDFQSEISGLLFCRCRAVLNKKNLTGEELVDDSGYVYLERKQYYQIWIHQYLKVKVIRHLFHSFPYEISPAKVMDRYRNRTRKPNSHRLFVTKENHAVFGESAFRGVLTKNCKKSMLRNGISLPSWANCVTKKEIVMGSLDCVQS